MRGLSRPKDSVASLAYDLRVHEVLQRLRSYDLDSPRPLMDCRVKPGNDGGVR
jgi:hypothetical protein